MSSDLRKPGAVSDRDEELWLQELAVHMAESGPMGVHFLLLSVKDASEGRLRAILIGLSAAKKLSAHLRQEICNVGKMFLDDSRPIIVAEAIDLLSRLDYTDAKAKIMKLRKHASPYVVGSVLRYLARHSPDIAIPLLVKALTSRQSIIRQNAIDELDDLHCVRALTAIKRLLRDKNRQVRQAALTAVRNLEELSQAKKSG